MGRLEEFFNSQLAQQQMQMPMAQLPYLGIGTGLLGMGGAIGNAMGGYGISTTAIPEAYQSQPNYNYHFPSVSDRIIRFFRINKAVEMYEGQKVEEPLDELRVKVANWLNN